MEHLSMEQIIEFVTAEELNEEFLRLASKVNGHIQQCAECFDAVDALQRLHDEYEDGLFEGSFAEFLKGKPLPSPALEPKPELQCNG